MVSPFASAAPSRSHHDHRPLPGAIRDPPRADGHARAPGAVFPGDLLANLNGDAPGRLGKAMLTLARGGKVTLASERQAISLAPETLQAYPGTYEIAPTFAIAIRVEGGKLIAQATGQGPIELFAEKPDHFFARAVDAQLVFTRDASGKVDGAVLHQNGRQMPAKRQ